jgi:copper chaperone NosL
MIKYLLYLPMFLMVTGAAAIAAEPIENPRDCRQCGMDRVASAHSRMMILYVDGTTAGTCSLNCAAVEMKKNKGKQVKSLKVADYNTRKLKDARTATWVIGGVKSGVMTAIPKWAFAKKGDAQKFVKEYGGRITNFGEALNLALRENE